MLPGQPLRHRTPVWLHHNSKMSKRIKRTHIKTPPIIPITFTESNRFPILPSLGSSPKFHLINGWCERNRKVRWAAWKPTACVGDTALCSEHTSHGPDCALCTNAAATDTRVAWHEHFRNWIFRGEHYRPQTWECFIKFMCQKEEENREEKMKKKWRIKKKNR